MDSVEIPAPTTKAPPTRGGPATNGVPRPRAIDRVRRAYHSAGRTRTLVPEWADDDGNALEVFFDPLTPADLDGISVKAMGSPQKSGYEEAVDLLILKLKDDHGQSIFDYRDKHALMHEAESGVILRLKNDIWLLSSLASVDVAKQVLGDDKALEFKLYLADRLKQPLDVVQSWPLDHLTLWSAYCAMHAPASAEG